MGERMATPELLRSVMRRVLRRAALRGLRAELLQHVEREPGLHLEQLMHTLMGRTTIELAALAIAAAVRERAIDVRDERAYPRGAA